MNLASRRLALVLIGLFLCVSSTRSASAQSCETSGDMDAATRTAISTAGQHYFDLAAKGDYAGLRQNAIPALAAAFSNAEALVQNRQPDLAGAQASVKSVFLLDATGAASLPRAEFYCGVFGKNGQTSGSAVFTFDNLPPGKYAVALVDATSPKARTSFTVILQQMGTDWKLGDLYIAPEQIAGHDSDWFAARAREYKTKSQLHNAWLYCLQARALVTPFARMSTLVTDKLYDECHSLEPADVPVNGKTVDLSAGTATYKLTAIFSDPVGNDLDLIVRYQAADISNSNQTYQTNVAVIKALVTKYPEVREAFAGVVARAVDPSGRDYGTLLAMKDVK